MGRLGARAAWPRCLGRPTLTETPERACSNPFLQTQVWVGSERWWGKKHDVPCVAIAEASAEVPGGAPATACDACKSYGATQRGRTRGGQLLLRRGHATTDQNVVHNCIHALGVPHLPAADQDCWSALPRWLGGWCTARGLRCAACCGSTAWVLQMMRTLTWVGRPCRVAQNSSFRRRGIFDKSRDFAASGTSVIRGEAGFRRKLASSTSSSSVRPSARSTSALATAVSQFMVVVRTSVGWKRNKGLSS